MADVFKAYDVPRERANISADVLVTADFMANQGNMEGNRHTCPQKYSGRN